MSTKERKQCLQLEWNYSRH